MRAARAFLALEGPREFQGWFSERVEAALVSRFRSSRPDSRQPASPARRKPGNGYVAFCRDRAGDSVGAAERIVRSANSRGPRRRTQSEHITSGLLALADVNRACWNGRDVPRADMTRSTAADGPKLS